MSIVQSQPETYTNSHTADADLLRRLRIALSVKRRAGWHLVSVDAQDGIVRLSGAVPSFYDRQLIAALVRHVAGVRGIDDRLTVGSSSIRQQVVVTEGTSSLSDAATEAAAANERLQRLPVLPHTLDDLIAQPALASLI